MPRNRKEKMTGSYSGLAEFELTKSPGSVLCMCGHHVISHPFERVEQNSYLVQASIVLLNTGDSHLPVLVTNQGASHTLPRNDEFMFTCSHSKS